MPETDMMPALPEPLEGLLGTYAEAYTDSAMLDDTESNHAAFEAERALRVAILKALRNAGTEAVNAVLGEALNSGDGTYRP